MSRHTKNDGKIPDKRIIENVSFDEWLKVFAPPEELIGTYYKKEISWENFEIHYLKYLRSNKIKPKIVTFAKRCAQETITLMCIEDSPEKCHRRLLAEELQRHQPNLKIIHK